MKIVFAYIKNQKAKVKAVGKTLDLLTLLTIISKCLTEKIAKEKQISLNEAEIFILDCIVDGMKTIKM